MSTNALFEKISLPSFKDISGTLTVFDKIHQFIDWPVKRSYWLTDVKAERGGHCVKGEKKFYVMARGSCTAKIYDGINWYEINLNGPSDALWLKDDLWREMTDFSEGAVMFTLCNMEYDKSKYILDINEYEKYKLNKQS